MQELKKIETKLCDELLKAFREMPQARTDYILRKQVVDGHDTLEQQYAHCVLELRMAYNNLRRAKIHLEKIDYEIDELKGKEDKLSEYEWKEKEIDREECECAVIGKLREFNCLYKIWQGYPKKFTRAEVNANQPEYWRKRAIRQCNQDVNATGRVGQGNQDLRRMLDIPISPTQNHIADVEQRFIQNSDGIRVMVAIPVEKHISKEEMEGMKMPCIEGLKIPEHYDYGGVFICHGRKTAAAYNEIVRVFLESGGDYLLTVEDDTFPPHDAFIRLMEHIADGKKIVGAWYPMRDGTGHGVPIVLGADGKRKPLVVDGEIHEVYTLPMGCTVYSKDVFCKIEQPFFQTTELLSQDSFFSQKLRDAGFKLYCDTSIRCKHIDRVTSKVYE